MRESVFFKKSSRLIIVLFFPPSYLKGKQVFSEEKEGSVSGSIGVRCLSGGKASEDESVFLLQQLLLHLFR